MLSAASLITSLFVLIVPSLLSVSPLFSSWFLWERAIAVISLYKRSVPWNLLLSLSPATDIRLLYPDTSSLILSAIESASALRLIVTGLSVVSESSSAYDLLIVIELLIEARSSSFTSNMALDGYCETLSNPRVLMSEAFLATKALLSMLLVSLK